MTYQTLFQNQPAAPSFEPLALPSLVLLPPLAARSDEELVQLLSQQQTAHDGKDAALRCAVLMVLYDRHCQFCFSFALRLLGNPAQAEEAMQVVYLALWHTPTSFSLTGKSFRGCLVTAMLDHLAALR